MKCSWSWCLLVLFCYGTLVQAAIRVDDLYEISIPVQDKSQAERNRAMGEALLGVLVRVSGLASVGQHPELISARNQAAHYVQQYLYKTQTRDTPAAGVQAGAAPMFLWLRFDEKLINQLLMSNGMPVWGGARPATLVWLAVDDLGERYLLGNEKGATLIAGLNEQARRRGLPLLFPLHDLEDQMHVGFVDVWGGFTAAIHKASLRYQAEAILVGRLYRDRLGGWKARWSLFDTKGEQQWSAAAEDPSVLLASTVDSIADVLGEQYAIQEDKRQQEGILLTVYGVNSLQDYARLSRYLQTSHSIVKAQVQELEADAARYTLEVRGDVAGVVRTFALENVLTPAPRNTVAEAPAPGATVVTAGVQKEPMPGTPGQLVDSQLYYRLVQ